MPIPSLPSFFRTDKQASQPFTEPLLKNDAPRFIPSKNANPESTRITMDLREVGIAIPHDKMLGVWHEADAEHLRAFAASAKSGGLDHAVLDASDDAAFRGAVTLIKLGLLPDKAFPDGPKNWAVVLAMFGSEPLTPGLLSLTLLDRFRLLHEEAGVPLQPAVVACIQNNKPELFASLVKAGALPETADPNGRTMWHAAVDSQAEPKVLYSLAEHICTVFDGRTSMTPMQYLFKKNEMLGEQLLDYAKTQQSPTSWVLQGDVLCLGLGREANTAPGLKLYQEAANQGHAIANYRLGRHYFAREPQTALTHFLRAAEQGVVPAQESLVTLRKKHYLAELTAAAACSWLRQAADAGYAPAQKDLGDFYQQGTWGLKKDPKEASTLHHLAADQGYLPALLAVGYAHDRENRKKDAVTYFQKAADLGDSVGQCCTARIHQFGWGVTVDLAEAERYFRASADQDYVPAQAEFGYLLLTLNRNEEARPFLEKAAAQGSPVAAWNMGVYWQRVASDRGFVRAPYQHPKCRDLMH